jgi:hypothetical protein
MQKEPRRRLLRTEPGPREAVSAATLLRAERGSCRRRRPQEEYNSPSSSFVGNDARGLLLQPCRGIEQSLSLLSRHLD